MLKRYQPSGRLLDVGCSAGFFLSAASGTYQVEGLELSHWSVGLAEKKGFTIHRKRLEEFYPTVPYDLITLWGVIEHFENPSAEIAHIGRMLAPGGHVALWTGDIQSLPARVLGNRWWYFLGQHIQMFTEKSIIRLFADNGFDPVHRGIYPYTVSLKSVNRSLRRYPWLHAITNPLFTHPLLSDRSITLKVPGEMFLVFRKRG